ncbi:hypothetical protein THAOC_07365 [Thalassiosira oceanica]|uniref:Peptidase C1A papain C-terminal domain-containing protein n=1 Tax=Thalassiosira oceanica TaxID=159749 RepID=K0TKM6_THAOC|nr:hypothetical protein THAOC_07365 [Thalassiosira oceanica]|eukprot:EJK71217.1 hypothetical protein THAOC_07365 [Thalassiosira oceanica]
MKMHRPTLLAVLAPVAAAYNADANNVHLQFASSPGSVSPEAVEEDARPEEHHLQLLEEHLVTVDLPNLDTAEAILGQFEEWVGRHSKSYESMEERARRMLVWADNHDPRRVPKVNGTRPLQPGASAQRHQGLELHGGRGGRLRRARGWAQGRTARRSGHRTPPVVKFHPDDNGGIDWHFKGLMGPVRNQGLCGACWAFSAIGSIESSMAIDKFNDMTPDEQRALSESKMSAVSGEALVDNDLGLVVPLSEQNLIDCDTLREKGCEGGLMVTDFDEEEVKNGVCAEADYPYLPPDPGNLRLFDVHPRPRLHSQGPRRHRPPKDKQPRRRPQGEAGHGRDGRERPHVPVLLLGSIHERHLWEGHEGDGNTGLQDALPRAGRLPPRHQPRRSCGGVRYGQDRGGRRAEGLFQGEEQLG